MKHLLLSLMTLAGLLCNLTIDAQHFTVGGINYEVLSKVEKTAKVGYNRDFQGGKAIIPETVEYAGVTFTVTAIDDKAFYNPGGMTSPSPVSGNNSESIETKRETGPTSTLNLTSVSIPNTVLSIGEDAFNSCRYLSEINIPAKVKSIGEEAFSFCEGLKSIKVDKNNKVYDSRDNCNAIIETLSNKLITGCRNTIIPESITEIEDRAFGGIKGLTAVVIPKNVKLIGDDIFFFCSDLKSIKVDKNNTVFDSRQDCNAIIETSTNTLIYGCKNSVIPEGITIIGEGAFRCVKGLTEITIPKGVKLIEDEAFTLCYDLMKVTILDGVASIGESAFRQCFKLTTVTLPEGLEKIEDYSFYGCQLLTDVKLPNSLKVIESYAFHSCKKLPELILPEHMTSLGCYAFDGCEGLKRVRCKASIPPEIETSKGEFPELVYKTVPLEVPEGSINAYKQAIGWKEFVTIKAMDTTGNEELEAGGIHVRSHDGKLFIDGLKYGTEVTVYTLTGHVATSFKAVSDKIHVSLSANRMYIVRIGGRSYKVVL